MFSVRIRHHFMIAHSFDSPTFGPAQNLHGATYVVDAEFTAPALNEDNIVIDIDLATRKLQEALAPLNYQNLDVLPQFEGVLTTTEFLAHYVHGQISKTVNHSFKGKLKVTLGESHVAWASYEGDVS